MKHETHVRYAKSSIERIKEWNIDEREKKKVEEYVKAYISGKITQRLGTNPDALTERLTQLLRVSLESIEKPTQKEVEKFFDNLVIKGKIKSYNCKTKDYTGEPYAPKTQMEIIVALKKYLLWRYKDAQLLVPLNIRIGKKEKDIESLTPEEVEKLYKGCKDDEERYIVSGLFSSGARAEEFLSLKISEIILPQNDEFIKVIIRNDTSKTKGRTNSLYWSQTLECIPIYLKQRAEEGARPMDFVLTRNYNSIQRWLSRLGIRVLNKRVHPHIFRHACADWLANRLNRQQMCIFFGWKFSSGMPDVYINRQNVNMKEVDEKVVSSNYQDLKDKMIKQEYDGRIKDEKIKQMEDDMKRFEEFKLMVMKSIGKKIENKLKS